MSLLAQSGHRSPSRLMSAIGGKADIAPSWRDVALMTQSGNGDASADIPIKGVMSVLTDIPSMTNVAHLLHGLEIKAPRAALLVSAGYSYA